MKKNGFTLIELLVVIAIIAVLAGMLLPSLSKAKEQGKLSVCLNNLKTMGVGNAMYADANEDYVIPGKWSGTGGLFYQALGSYGCDWQDSYTNNHLTKGTFACPSERQRFGWSSGEFSHTHYAANGYLCGWSDLASSYADAGVRRKMNQVSAPSIALLISDSGDSGNPAVIWRDCLGFRHKGGVVTGPVNGYYKKTSNGSMNMVFADGHCEVQKFQEVESLTTPSSAPFFRRGIRL